MNKNIRYKNHHQKAKGRFSHSNTPFLYPRKAVLLLEVANVAI